MLEINSTSLSENLPMLVNMAEDKKIDDSNSKTVNLS